MKFLPRVCDPSLFSRLPGTQFPVSMVHSGNSFSKLATEQYYILYEMAMVQNTYGTKWLWCKSGTYGTKWFLDQFKIMGRNWNFVVRNGKLWYEMAMVRNGYGTK